MFKFTVKPLLAFAITTSAILPLPAAACSPDSYLGTICAFGFNFCPQGYLPADGRLIQISQNTALFSLLGTTYGGNGTSTFALPDLRGRSLVGSGQGPGLTNIIIGQVGGTESASLLITNLPSHSHGASTTLNISSVANASGSAGNSASPTAKVWANSSSRDNVYGDTGNVQMAAGAITTTGTATTTVQPTGSGIPVSIRSPYVGITYCIATTGIFPSRP
jgi:microcystin-dependent protein